MGIWYDRYPIEDLYWNRFDQRFLFIVPALSNANLEVKPKKKVITTS